MNRFYGFRLTRAEDKLHLRHGLLTLSEDTLPIKKIQAVLLRSNALMRSFGWWRMDLHMIGQADEKGGRRVVIPFADLETIHRIGQHIIPFSLPAAYTSVSPLHRRRLLIRYGVAAAAVVGVAALFYPAALFLVIAFPLLPVAAKRQYEAHGFVFSDDLLFVRRGVLVRRIWIVPYRKFQAIQTTATLFQRRLGVKNLSFDLADVGAGRPPTIRDLPAYTADLLAREAYRLSRSHSTA